ncbi:hypothetical protein [Cellulomonas endophytica]|uniref:hypothetical protein n=1 Tax=Cellulomonas endophytica TaxID=2494735 RepID=UPI0010125961|nr:hypothetical protein [Cellulomonas endophytica]
MTALPVPPRTLRLPVLHLGRLRGALVLEVGTVPAAAARRRDRSGLPRSPRRGADAAARYRTAAARIDDARTAALAARLGAGV